MLILDSTTVALGALLDEARNNALQCFVAYVDQNSSTGTLTPGQQNVSGLSNVAMTDILNSPASGVTRRAKLISIANTDNIPHGVTVFFDTNVAAAGPVDYTAAYDSNDASNVTSGGTISQLTDLSGNGRHLTQATGANQPAVVSGTAPDGTTKTLLQFTAANQQWLESSADWSTFVSANTWTVIAECQFTGVPTSGSNVFINNNNAFICDNQDESFHGIAFRMYSQGLNTGDGAHNGPPQCGTGSVNTSFIENNVWQTFTTDVWYTITGKRDTTYLYNQLGRSAPALNSVLGTTGISGTAGHVVMGRSAATATVFYNGFARRCRIWNRALTADEINSTIDEWAGFTVRRNIYHAEIAPNESIQYTDGEGWTIRDAMGNRKSLLNTPATYGGPMEVGSIRTATAIANGTLFLQRQALAGLSFQPDVAAIPLCVNITGGNSSAAALSMTMHVGAYKFSGSTLSLMANGSRQLTFNTIDPQHSYGRISGTNFFTVPLQSWNLTPGDYMLAFLLSASTSSTSVSLSYFMNRTGVSFNGSEFGGGTGNFTAPLLWGVYSAATSSLPPAIAWSEVNQTGNAVFAQQPWFALGRTNFTNVTR